MATEIEKTFFDTFGIEPNCQNKFINPYKCPFNEQRECCDCVSFEYPTITNRILLELICLCPDLDEVFFTDVKQLKETLLTSYIKIYKYYTEVERLSDCEKELKHQVRTLFEEG